MAASQFDPSRLQGEALRRWYQRSPQQIQEERQAAAAQRYRAFFQPNDVLQRQHSNHDDFAWQSAPHLQDGQRPASPSPATVMGVIGTGARPGLGRLRSAYGHAASAVAGAGDCVTCHGRVPPPLPFPFPFVPSFRDTPLPPAGGGSPKRRLRQCDVQYDNDSEICRTLPNAEVRRRCWQSAAERRGYCRNHDGEVGWPPLLTR